VKAQIDDRLWHELGRGIGNEDLSDLAGYAVSLSKSGFTAAVGSPLHTSLIETNPDERAGRVRVYRYNRTRDAWRKVGQDLEGDMTNDNKGASVHVTDEGTSLIIGSPQARITSGKIEAGCATIYELTMEEGPEEETYEIWMEVGDPICGENSFDHFGTSVQLAEFEAANGQNTYRAIIGSPGARASGAKIGLVSIYEYKNSYTNPNSEWTLIDTIRDIDPSPFSNFGATFDVTSDLKTIAIGAPNHGTLDQGAVRIYSVDDEGRWKSVVAQTDSQQHDKDNNCGTSVTIDASGKYLAYGCPGYMVNEMYKAGQVIILTRKASSNGNISWVRTDHIFGENEGDNYGTSVQLSDLQDGVVYLAIGAPNNTPENDLARRNAGHVRVYYNSYDGSWLKAGLDIDGLSSNNQFGASVDISGMGHTVIAGAPEGGYAKIYNLAFTAPPSPAPTMSPDNLEMKKRSSVWMVFMITVFSFGMLAAIFTFMMKSRQRNNNSFSGVQTEEVVTATPNMYPGTFPAATTETETEPIRDVI